MPRREPRPPTPLKVARLQARLTQLDLAVAVGCHPTSIGLAERGALSVEMARRCAKVLGCRPADLLPPERGAGGE